MYKSLLAAAVLVLAGCSSTAEPVTTTYLLPMNEASTTLLSATAQQPVMIVRPVEVAQHLGGTGLVYQVSPTEVVQAQHNLWAESLSKQLTRAVIDDLRQKQSTYWFDQLTPVVNAMDLPKLQLQFTQFNGHYSGLAQLSGQWMVVNGEGEAVIRQPFFIQVPLAEDGYNAQVKALSEGVERLTTQISQRVSHLRL
ncbi:ABC-type transport auxiliary lipoprotein family protein [Photobacterium japonica]|uniref:PqiC family protein n=1 Tax=Photobacterium japonica TaxID=2910235 RepID=UPI003D0A23AB